MHDSATLELSEMIQHFFLIYFICLFFPPKLIFYENRQVHLKFITGFFGFHSQQESPVFGASGQEELAKRLAELELNRELLDELGEDQDWFDEDFGLSSRREQQRQKQKEEEARLAVGGGGLVPSQGVDQQVKIPPRPELPLPLPPKLPEQPAMVVPHSATEVERMVHAATQEIWESYGLGLVGAPTLSHLPNPTPSQEYLGKDASSQDPEHLCIRSYKKVKNKQRLDETSH